MSAAIVRNATDDDINEIFDRINTYGHRLSNQERRQAGVASDFAKTVRQLSASLRGDVSREKLPLFEMPSISIETPTAKHGYQVKAEEVFWVRHGIVLAGDLRESQDEECVADLAASIVQGSAINRARAALDALYDESLEEGAANAAAFIKYGEDKLIDEIKYIVGEVEVLAESDEFSPLKRRLFNKVQGNAFPTIFSTLFLALHRKIVVENKRISSYRDLAKALTNLGDKLDAGKKGATVEQRKQNIDMVCGVIDPHMVVDVSVAGRIYNNHNIVAIEDAIRRSQVETASYELKGGLLPLVAGKAELEPMMEKIAKTLVGIANNGPNRYGKLLLGVCDKDADAERVMEIDKVAAREIASRKVVGVNREARRLGVTLEKYIQSLRDYISKSRISSPLREQLLADLDYNDYYGLGLIVITVAPQKEVSYFDNRVFFRNGDQTVEVLDVKQGIEVARRFGT